jgi:hypothetical protein
VVELHAYLVPAISLLQSNKVMSMRRNKRYQSGTAKSCGIKTKYDSIVQHTMVILIQMVEGDS